MGPYLHFASLGPTQNITVEWQVLSTHESQMGSLCATTRTRQVGDFMLHKTLQSMVNFPQQLYAQCNAWEGGGGGGAGGSEDAPLCK